MILKSPYFLSLHLFFLILSAWILLHFFPVGGSLDMRLIQPWLNPHGVFPLRDHWALAKLNHTYVKQLIITVYLLYLLGWLSSFKIAKYKVRRVDYGYFFFVSMLCTGVVGLVKSQAAAACPWNMTIPTAAGVLWDLSATQGHCFPGGHAATGFALITGYFVYRLNYPSRAYFFLITGILLGFAMGWAQMMRGAHFLSHNLWTLWVCWCVNVIVYIFYFMWSGRDAALKSRLKSTN